jgi:aspartyl-tRNA(Asn)/glutamyl-tRNA(Gln) amidotransferase subunit A
MPASYCGIVGLKPTYGRVSNRGVVPLSWSLDHVGPLCRSVQDAALMLEVISGFDKLDPASADVPVPHYSRELKTRTARMRVGIPRETFFDDLDPEIAAALGSAIEVLSKLTASVEDVKVPATGNLLQQILSPELHAVHAASLATSPEKYQPSTRERIIAYAAAVSQEEYVSARRQCDLLRREIGKVFETVDVLAMPTMARPPALLDPNFTRAPREPERTRNTWPFNVYGVPAITVPCGFTRSGLPIGLQIVGAPFAESTVLALAYAYEQMTEWHARRPSLAT